MSAERTNGKKNFPKEDEMLMIAKYFLGRNIEGLKALFAVALFGGMGSLVMEVRRQTFIPDSSMGVTVYGVVVSVFIGAVAYVIGWYTMRRLARAWVRHEFKNLFGVNTPCKKTDSYERSVIQALVDNSLTERAKLFNLSCEGQRCVLGQRVDASCFQKTKDHLEEYRKAVKNIAVDKKYFWHCHEVAALNGMNVRPSFWNYLRPEPEDAMMHVRA